MPARKPGGGSSGGPAAHEAAVEVSTPGSIRRAARSVRSASIRSATSTTRTSHGCGATCRSAARSSRAARPAPAHASARARRRAEAGAPRRIAAVHRRAHSDERHGPALARGPAPVRPWAALPAAGASAPGSAAAAAAAEAAAAAAPRRRGQTPAAARTARRLMARSPSPRHPQLQAPSLRLRPPRHRRHQAPAAVAEPVAATEGPLYGHPVLGAATLSGHPRLSLFSACQPARHRHPPGARAQPFAWLRCTLRGGSYASGSASSALHQLLIGGVIGVSWSSRRPRVRVPSRERPARLAKTAATVNGEAITLAEVLDRSSRARPHWMPRPSSIRPRVWPRPPPRSSSSARTCRIRCWTT